MKTDLALLTDTIQNLYNLNVIFQEKDLLLHELYEVVYTSKTKLFLSLNQAMENKLISFHILQSMPLNSICTATFL
jgi:hypothetical protein